ncbi:G patch domain-containing protein 3-like [Lineus longissimus]|uniref:G patch domain-containing protein 3-like n=1 Tax=Lineus longissimus TaxID=88925 RepID=UPI00315DB3C0
MSKVAQEPLNFGLVGNIPEEYHSADLRNFFSQFIESGGFDCFHYRHRPEKKVLLDESGLRQEVGEPSSKGNPQMQNVTNSSSPQTNCNPSTSSACSTSDKQTVIDSSKLSCTKCCLIRLKKLQMDRLLKMYNKKHWLDKKGDSIARVCLITRVSIGSDESSRCSAQDAGYKTRREQRQVPEEREKFTLEDLNKLAELHPPAIMPNGNVGTQTKVFMDLIRDCMLPPGVIKKLGLSFPKMRCKRRYGNVPFDYGDDVIFGAEEDDVVLSADGHELCSNLKKLQKRKSSKKLVKEAGDSEDEQEQEQESGSDDDTCEEWERHEALYDDPDNQERNKERLFEEKIELKWEKGGSGLVFYTDATYWQQQEGDFDEQTADDWDVDMSEYYDPGSGDMDAKALITMGKEKRRRAGIFDPDDHIFSGKIGKFEKYTKGIGRKVLEKQGWKEGTGLGSTIIGMADALENEGHAPRCRDGFGYHGEKLNRYPVKKDRGERDVFIPTVYDKPTELDQPDTLRRRKSHYTIKYRDKIAFTKASDDQT